MELERRRHVDVGHAVAVGEEERLVVGQVLANAQDSPTRHGLEPRVHDGDAPREPRRLVVGDVARAEVEGHVGVVKREVREVLLQQVALVARTDDEVDEPVRGIDVHDVPDDRPAADLDQRLGAHDRLLRESRAAAARKDHRLHPAIPA